MDRRIVPFDVNAGIFCAFPIHVNLVVFFNCHLEVTSVAFSGLYHPKIINDQQKCDGAPLVAPQARGDRALVVAMLDNVFTEQIIGYLSTLGQTLVSFADFEIGPPVTIVVVIILFVD